LSDAGATGRPLNGAALRRSHASRRVVQVSGDAEWSLQDARRGEHWATHAGRVGEIEASGVEAWVLFG
jgi:hypothetical protein